MPRHRPNSHKEVVTQGTRFIVNHIDVFLSLCSLPPGSRLKSTSTSFSWDNGIQSRASHVLGTLTSRLQFSLLFLYSTCLNVCTTKANSVWFWFYHNPG